ncbi:MAG: hypothetical protein M1840_000212 [Geoglossum simile]|nr:MAG: hypothetical protein M1840_000212 [Geoglossum simile]
MATLANLRDDRSFPIFPFCPLDTNIDPNFFERTGNDIFRPRRHWCLLAEITEEKIFPCLQLFAIDKLGVEFPVGFHPRRGDRCLDPALFRAGRTIAIMYAQQHRFYEQAVGVLQEAIGAVKVIPLPLRRLLALSDRVQAQTSMIEGKRVCHACGKRGDALLLCGRCHLSWYCDKECQTVGWLHKNHKADCKVLKDKDVRGIFTLDWERFDGFVQFPL